LRVLHHTYTKVGKRWREKECDEENGAELSRDKFNASVCQGRCQVHLIRYTILTFGKLRYPATVCSQRRRISQSLLHKDSNEDAAFAGWWQGKSCTSATLP